MIFFILIDQQLLLYTKTHDTKKNILTIGEGCYWPHNFLGINPKFDYHKQLSLNIFCLLIFLF